jgi:hypothetical protein
MGQKQRRLIRVVNSSGRGLGLTIHSFSNISMC